MVARRFDESQALAHLWFGVNVSGICDEDTNPLSELFKSDTTLIIHNGDVMYRGLLADVARKLAADVDKSKTFIQYVINTVQDWSNRPNAENFMPPQEKEQNFNVFVPCLIDLFKEADEQCLIEPPDLTKLAEWLDKCGSNKIARGVRKFNHELPFKKDCKHSRQHAKIMTRNFFSYCLQGSSQSNTT